MSEKSPLDILMKEEQIDLVAYDYLFARFIRGEWGSQNISNPEIIASIISKFLVQTENLNITLTKE